MKKSIIIITACFLFFSCKKEQKTAIEDKSIYFFKTEVGPFKVDISMTEQQLKDSEKASGLYQYHVSKSYYLGGHQYSIQVIDRDAPSVVVGITLPSLDKGSYTTKPREVGMTLALEDMEKREWPYRTLASDNTFTPLTINITESTTAYVEGNFSGTINGLDRAKDFFGYNPIILLIKGSFRVKRINN